MSTRIPTNISEPLFDSLSDAYHATTEAFLSGDHDLMAEGLTSLQRCVTLCNKRIGEYLGLQDSRLS